MRFLLIAVFLYSTMCLAQTFEPLSSKDGITNHPVLFAHGLGSNMKDEWGALPIKLDDSEYCEINLENDLFFTYNFDWQHKRMKHWYKFNRARMYFEIEIKITACGQTKTLLKIDRKEWKIAERSCGNFKDTEYGSKCNGDLNKKKFTSVEVDVINQISKIVYQYTGTDNTSSMDYEFTLRAKDWEELNKNLDEFQDNNQGATIILGEEQAVPIAQEALLDVPERYKIFSTPWKIANELNLNVGKDKIASNGLYFFNAKNYFSDVLNISNCDRVIKNYSLETSSSIQVSNIDGSLGSRYLSVPFRYSLECEIDGGVLADEQWSAMYTIDLSKYDPNSTCDASEAINSLSFNQEFNQVRFSFCGSNRTVEVSIPESEMTEYRAKLDLKLSNLVGKVAYGPNTNPRWAIEERGQASQLARRIDQVLSDYYGSVNWYSTITNPKIDLVGYSQGGLVIRLMVDKLNLEAKEAVSNTDRLKAQKILSAINHIISVDSPHLGAAIATSQEMLKNEPHPQSGREISFELLGEEIDYLDNAPPELLVDINHNDVFDVELWDDVGLDLEISGPYLGPLKEEKSQIKVFGLDLNKCNSWYDRYTLGVFCYRTLKYDFPIQGMLNELNEKVLEKTREKILNMRKNASYLSWDGDEANSLISELLELPFPNNNGLEIPTSHIATPSAGSLFSLMVDDLKYEIYKACLNQLPDVGPLSNNSVTCGRISDLLASNQVFFRGAAKRLDLDWASKSDITVEEFSQKAIYTGGVFSENNPKFRAIETNRKELVHVPIPLLQENPILVASNQGCDILGALGGSCIEALAPPVTSPTFAKTLSPNRLDDIEVQALSNVTSSKYKAKILYRRNAATDVNKLELKYWFNSDPIQRPSVKLLSGNADLNLVNLKDGLFELTITAEEQIPNGQYKEWVIEFSHKDGSYFVPSDDWSSPLSSTLTRTSRIGVTVNDDYESSIGFIPDVRDESFTQINKALVVRSKERSIYKESSPELEIINGGYSTIKGFSAHYYFRSTKPPKLRTYWRPAQSESRIYLSEILDGYWAVIIEYPNYTLRPGERISNIGFELYHEGGEAHWYWDDDPSYLADNLNEFKMNPKIPAFDLNDNQIFGDDMSYIWDVEPAVEQVTVTAKESSQYPSHKILDFKIENSGALPINGLSFEYMYTVESLNPMIQVINAPTCLVTNNHVVDKDYLLKINCPTVSIEPTSQWPITGADKGMTIEIQGPGGSPVDLQNDYSYLGIEANWSLAPKLVVRNNINQVIWGY